MESTLIWSRLTIALSILGLRFLRDGLLQLYPSNGLILLGN